VSARPRLGLVLGSGSARGWAHIGVIRALVAGGIEPDIICGCSAGAFVGAAYANGDLQRLEQWVLALRRRDVLALLDLGLKGGLIKGHKLVDLFAQFFVERDFTQLAKPFACVATDLESGHEVWLREGSVAAAVRASIALPGLFAPAICEGRVLVDGALVNPVPVSLCRAMGAEIVIAVDLGSDLVGRFRRDVPRTPGLFDRLRGESVRDAVPSLLEVLSASLNIMQARITRSRLAGEPADVLIAPRLSRIGLMDYQRGDEAIAEGAAAVDRQWPAIRHALWSEAGAGAQ